MPSFVEKLPEPYQSLFEAMLWDCGAEAVPELVAKGADLSYCHPSTGKTALYAATINDRVRAIQALLQHGADPNQRFTYRSPVDGRVEADRIALHYAASAEAAAVFIKAGAKVNAADANATTPLMCAAFHGHTAVVRSLLEAGAYPLSRQQKRRGRRARTAREFVQSKIEFFEDAVRQTVQDERRKACEERLRCYEEIRIVLLEAENGVVVT